MTTTPGRGRKASLFTLTTAALFGAALLFAAVAPASAKDNGNHGRGQQGKGHPGKSQQAHARQYRVPQVIAVDHRSDYRPYYSGRSYYAPHRHEHVRYRFPVWVNGVVTHRSYAYCQDHLFVSGVVNLPQLAIAFNFGQPGLVVGGYYGTPPPAYYGYGEPRYDERRHDEHRYDGRRYDDHRHDDCH